MYNDFNDNDDDDDTAVAPMLPVDLEGWLSWTLAQPNANVQEIRDQFVDLTRSLLSMQQCLDQCLPCQVMPDSMNIH